MGIDAWITVGVVVSTLAVLIGTRISPDFVLVGAVTVLMLTGVLPVVDALSGLANPGLATVGVLYIVAAGLVNTGAAHALGTTFLGRPRTTATAQIRLMLPAAAASGFLNNTPLVAMLVPVVEEWGRRCRISLSKLMIPLSYATILGGMITLIGTSTNVVVYGLVLEDTTLGPMGFWEIGLVGLPCTLVGLVYMVATQKWLLPERKPPLAGDELGRLHLLDGMRLEAETKHDAALVSYDMAAKAMPGEVAPTIAAATLLGRMAEHADSLRDGEKAKEFRAQADEKLGKLAAAAEADPALAVTLGVAYLAAGAAQQSEQWLRKALSLAVDVCNEFRAEPSPITVVENLGQGAAGLPTDDSHLVYRAIRRAHEQQGRAPPPLRLRCDNRIPLSRGMGSSSSAIVAGLLLGNRLLGDPLDRDALLDLATEMEGHPDNVVSCLLGGVQVSATNTSSKAAVTGTTDKDGNYTLAVPAGSYNVTASLSGFKKVTQSAEVAEGASVKLDFALGVKRRQVVEVDAVAQFFRRLVVDGIHLHQREIPLGFFRRAYFAVNRIAGAKAKALHLAWADVNIIRPGQIVFFRRSQEAKTVLQHFQNAGPGYRHALFGQLL